MTLFTVTLLPLLVFSLYLLYSQIQLSKKLQIELFRATVLRKLVEQGLEIQSEE